MKKISLVLILVFLFLAGCTDNPRIESGKYYLEGDDTVFIEIINNKEIAFYGIDFSAIEAELSEVDIEVDVAANLSDKYDTNQDCDRLYVEILGVELDGFPVTLTLRYSKEKKEITLSNRVYTKEPNTVPTSNKASGNLSQEYYARILQR